MKTRRWGRSLETVYCMTMQCRIVHTGHSTMMVTLRRETLYSFGRKERPTSGSILLSLQRPTTQEENNELMALSLNLLDKKRETGRLRNWFYQQDVARTYNRKVRTRTFQQGDWVLRRAEKTTGKKDPIRSLRCGEQAPTGYKIANVKYNPTAGTPCTSNPIIFNTVPGP
ncbi:hypothetical protein F2Q69_00021698 [Brassica cretica]|uniref:Uncharacterized protein n=1 Tax=Brassica cretica TaxID=69181 RepID=A0A8S9Q7Y5_BRACR|nr:hypothetical protein F2Q69_00021698 [Brassica cretica]